ncbi:MAG: HU family DNA-binding protein [Kiritimatiellia bacterium]
MKISKSFTKSRLISEIAKGNGLSKAIVGRMLDQLTAIAYREAENGFVIPGICKLKVVAKKASRHRNPFTGKLLLIGERKAVKIVPLKRAKTAIAPNKDVTVQIIDDLTPLDLNAAKPEFAAPAPAVSAASGDAPASGTRLPEGEDGQVVFPCPECGSMIAAPPKSAGKKGDCPFCKAALTVPQRNPDVKPDKQVLEGQSEAQVTDFMAFVCQACGQEIEAPVDMVGMSVECPTCGTGLTVPIANAPKPPPQKTSATPNATKPDVSSMTIRIDLSDLQ